MEHRNGSKRLSTKGWLALAAVCLLALGAATFIVPAHRSHAVSALPYLFVLACPLIHLFAHGGHGRHGAAGAVQKTVERG